MNEMENFVAEATENVEATATEETVGQVVEPEKVYSQEEFDSKFNEGVGKKLARQEKKLRKEYDRDYGELLDVLKAGTGFGGSVKEITSSLKDFYSERGVDFSKEPTYTKKDIEVLARAEADDVIKMGYEDVVEEINRYADIGIENLDEREQAVLKMLAEHQDKTEKVRELSKIGVNEDIIESKDFKEFASNFKSDTPITKIYEYYNKTQPKKEIKTMGSVKNTTVESAVKDYYSPEEARKFSLDDLMKNPKLRKSIEESMEKWKY
jgi:hypothetical protein